jgi:hypothetical protein
VLQELEISPVLMPREPAARTAATMGSHVFMPRNMLSIRSVGSSTPSRSPKRRSNSSSLTLPVSSWRRSATAPGSSRNRRFTASSSRPFRVQNSAKLSQTDVVITPPKSTSRAV